MNHMIQEEGRTGRVGGLALSVLSIKWAMGSCAERRGWGEAGSTRKVKTRTAVEGGWQGVGWEWNERPDSESSPWHQNRARRSGRVQLSTFFSRARQFGIQKLEEWRWWQPPQKWVKEGMWGIYCSDSRGDSGTRVGVSGGNSQQTKGTGPVSLFQSVFCRTLDL